MKYVYQTTSLTVEDVYLFLTKCDKQFSPLLSARVNLKEYSEKLILNSTIIHVKSNGELIGLIAFYMNNNSQGYAFISLICVLNEFGGNGIGSILMKECVALIMKGNFKSIKLEVDTQNQEAITFYQNFGFFTEDQKQNSWLMTKLIN
jgi:ribosomal protein S18 acetylase RimI-like enzyme